MSTTAKLLHHVLAKQAQEFGRALGPNQRPPSWMWNTPASMTTPMNDTRPVAADVPKLPATPSVPPLPGMPSAPITSPTASGATVPGPNKDVANFAKSSAQGPALGFASEEDSAAIRAREAAAKAPAAPVDDGIVSHSILLPPLEDPVAPPTAPAPVAAPVIPKKPMPFRPAQPGNQVHPQPVGPGQRKRSEAISSMNGTTVNVSPAADKAVAPGVSAAPGIAASGAAMVLKQVLAKKRRMSAAPVVAPKMAADFTGEKADPAFAKAMADQAAKVNADAAKVVAKSKVGRPAVSLPVKPVPGLGKNNSAKLAMEAGDLAAGALGAGLGGYGGHLFQANETGPTQNRLGETKGPILGGIVGAGVGLGAAALLRHLLGKKSKRAADSTVTVGTIKAEPKTNLKGKVTTPVITTVTKKAMQFGMPNLTPPAVEPSAWDKIKSTSGDVLGATTNYLKGFAQNPTKWDAGHIAGAAVGATGAALLLSHLLGGRKRREPAYEG